MKIRHYLALALLSSLGLGLSACHKQDQGPIDKASENVKDGLDIRENEKLKDTGEDLKDAGHDAKEAVKDSTN